MKTLITAAAMCLGLAANAQSYNDLVEVLRSDIRTEKQAIVLANMGLNEQQSAAFNPIYTEYQNAMKLHWDKRIKLIKGYGDKYATMDDASAKTMLAGMNALEKENLSIRNTYEKKMMKVLPATTVARWAQIEGRLSKMIDLQLAEEIPLMPSKK